MKKSGNEIYDAAYKATGHNRKKSLEIVRIVNDINKMGGFNYRIK